MFWIDDVYLFGMLPKAVGGVAYYNLRLNAYLSLDADRAIDSTRRLGAASPMLASVIGERRFLEYWGLIQSVYSWSVDTRFVE